MPSQVKISPDGKCATYLRPAEHNRERLELWLVELASGATRRLLAGDEGHTAAITEEEKAERERRRQFAHGVTAYSWHPDGGEILFPANGAAFVLNVADGAVRRLTPKDTRQSGIQYSAKGNFVSYVRDGDLYCLRIASGEETRLTSDGGGTVTNGLPEFIAQEEMGRFKGHWWSPDESAIAFTRVDTAAVAETNRHEIGPDGIQVIAQRYPFAGEANAEVRLGTFDIRSGEVTWLDWQLADDDYLAQVQFAPDGVALRAGAVERPEAARRAPICEDGQWRDIVVETATKWVNLGDRLTLLKERWPSSLWLSELGAVEVGTPQLRSLRPRRERRVAAAEARRESTAS